MRKFITGLFGLFGLIWAAIVAPPLIGMKFSLIQFWPISIEIKIPWLSGEDKRDTSAPSRPDLNGEQPDRPLDAKRSTIALRVDTAPRPIVAEPQLIDFFNPDNGTALVWYSEGRGGAARLFDSKGFDPETGAELLPVTREIVAEIFARAEADKQEKKRKQLADLFDIASYSNDVVIVGGISREKNEISVQATNEVLNSLRGAIRSKGMAVDNVRSAVYSSEHFDSLMDGRIGILEEVGLVQKMRAALLTELKANCHPASEFVGTVTCSISAKVRLFTSSGNGSLHQWFESGAGTTPNQALSAAAERLGKHYPELLDGI